MKPTYLTKQGIDKLQSELKQLIDIDRKEIIKKIKETREYGDLSENAEYDAARAQQSMIEGRIEELEALLKNVQIIEHTAKVGGAATLGSTVKAENEGDVMSFTIVGSAESDPANGLISVDSPTGDALLGAKAGQTVVVTLPEGGKVEYKIIEVI